jgi:hypothetical protein
VTEISAARPDLGAGGHAFLPSYAVFTWIMGADRAEAVASFDGGGPAVTPAAPVTHQELAP